ncbi:hypothetical protein AY599_13090 [Leptolyngbya valderiana BDU 20041]|nr:hypothetical protein AY599_13090 [Leptolyngbya valderiana BDU 20041]
MLHSNDDGVQKDKRSNAKAALLFIAIHLLTCHRQMTRWEDDETLEGKQAQKALLRRLLKQQHEMGNVVRDKRYQ